MQDRIERSVMLHAPLERVWSALTDAEQFGAWFGVVFETPFRPGATSWGRITNPPSMAHLRFAFRIIAMEPWRFAYAWHPNAIDPAIDYSAETPTIVEFLLTPLESGTRLDLTETGFAQLPPGRYADALRMNSSGWETQVERIRVYVEG